MKLLSELRAQTIALMRAGKRAPAPSAVRVESRWIGRRLRACLGSGEAGGALIEFALVVPLLLMILTAIFAFGIVINSQITLTNAVGAGAQYLQIIRTSTSDPCADTLGAITNAAPSINPSKINLTFTLNATVVTGNSCPSHVSDLVPGAPVTVQATYPCNLLIFGSTFASACQLSAKVTEYEY